MEDRFVRVRIKFIFFSACAVAGFFVLSILLQGSKFSISPFWSFRIPAVRGRILDAQGRLCAYDQLIYVAYLDVGFLKANLREKTLPQLKILLDNFSHKVSVDEILLGSKRFIRLGQAATHDELLAKIPTELLKFVSIEYETVRNRLEEYGVGKILGRVIDGKGVGGIEEAMNSALTKKSDGKLKVRYKGFLTVSMFIDKIVPPNDGKDVKLTIDLDLQRIAYEEIITAVQQNKALSGGVIIMESKTGKIRAMATTREWNDAVMGYFEPGSAIKPIVYAVALEEKIASLENTFHCSGKIQPVEDVNVVVRDLYAHDQVDLTEALVVSCNSATILLARQIKEKLGDYQYHAWLRRFGFGHPTGVQLAGEIAGVLREPEKWSRIDFAMISIGQGIGATPLQFASAFNVLANNGVYVAPTIVEGIETEKRVVLSKEVSATISDVLAQVVERGTGVKAQVPNLRVAGKTGTAQKIAVGEDKYYSIFVGFYPHEDPKYTILIWLDEPSADQYLAGEVAAPVFAKIVKRILELSKEQIMSFPKGVVPDLRGLTLRDAFAVLKHLGFENIEIYGTGIVKDQYPSPGTTEVEKIVLFLESAQP